MRQIDLIPSAVTTNLTKDNHKHVDIRLCYRIKYPMTKTEIWFTACEHTITKGSIFIPDLIDSVKQKYHIPFISDIKKGDVITSKHRKIMDNYKMELFPNYSYSTKEKKL